MGRKVTKETLLVVEATSGGKSRSRHRGEETSRKRRGTVPHARRGVLLGGGASRDEEDAKGLGIGAGERLGDVCLRQWRGAAAGGGTRPFSSHRPRSRCQTS